MPPKGKASNVKEADPDAARAAQQEAEEAETKNLYLQVAATTAYPSTEKFFLRTAEQYEKKAEDTTKNQIDTLSTKEIPALYHKLTDQRHQHDEEKEKLFHKILSSREIHRERLSFVAAYRKEFAVYCTQYFMEWEALQKNLLLRRQRAEDWERGEKSVITERLQRFKEKRMALAERREREERAELQKRARNQQTLKLAFEDCLEEIKQIMLWHLAEQQNGAESKNNNNNNNNNSKNKNNINSRQQHLLQILGPEGLEDIRSALDSIGPDQLSSEARKGIEAMLHASSSSSATPKNTNTSTFSENENEKKRKKNNRQEAGEAKKGRSGDGPSLIEDELQQKEAALLQQLNQHLGKGTKKGAKPAGATASSKKGNSVKQHPDKKGTEVDLTDTSGVLNMDSLDVSSIRLSSEKGGQEEGEREGEKETVVRSASTDIPPPMSPPPPPTKDDIAGDEEAIQIPVGRAHSGTTNQDDDEDTQQQSDFNLNMNARPKLNELLAKLEEIEDEHQLGDNSRLRRLNLPPAMDVFPATNTATHKVVKIREEGEGREDVNAGMHVDAAVSAAVRQNTTKTLLSEGNKINRSSPANTGNATHKSAALPPSTTGASVLLQPAVQPYNEKSIHQYNKNDPLYQNRQNSNNNNNNNNNINAEDGKGEAMEIHIPLAEHNYKDKKKSFRTTTVLEAMEGYGGNERISTTGTNHNNNNVGENVSKRELRLQEKKRKETLQRAAHYAPSSGSAQQGHLPNDPTNLPPLQRSSKYNNNNNNSIQRAVEESTHPSSSSVTHLHTARSSPSTAHSSKPHPTPLLDHVPTETLVHTVNLLSKEQREYHTNERPSRVQQYQHLFTQYQRLNTSTAQCLMENKNLERDKELLTQRVQQLQEEKRIGEREANGETLLLEDSRWSTSKGALVTTTTVGKGSKRAVATTSTALATTNNNNNNKQREELLKAQHNFLLELQTTLEQKTTELKDLRECLSSLQKEVQQEESIKSSIVDYCRATYRIMESDDNSNNNNNDNNNEVSIPGLNLKGEREIAQFLYGLFQVGGM